MTKKEELKQVLRELNQEGDTAAARARAAELLKQLDAATLSLAEQELLEEGAVDEEELRSLCQVHLGVLGEELERQRPGVDSSHPIGILSGEHQIILRRLEELHEIAGKVREARGFSDIPGQVERLRAIALLLLDTEYHHKREEEALFPRLERHGVTGPPRIMRLEHEDLRAQKKRLAQLLEQAGKIDYPEFAAGVGEVGSYLASTLGDHIFKEDNILYPTALDTLDPEEWSELLKEFDRIGYCSFTPRPSGR